MMKNITLLSCLTLLLLLPCFGTNSTSPDIKIHFPLSVDSLQLKETVNFLSNIQPARNYKHPEILDSIATYIFTSLQASADTVYYQQFTIHGVNYKNIIAKYGVQFSKKIIVGAHYDTCHELPGADDNASGIAGLLEIGRNIIIKNLKHQIELVAYTLEEPPFFRTDQMGSAIHAESIDKKNVLGMVCLEMIGYYSNLPNSQEYPVQEMKFQYPNTGNFIAVIGRLNQAVFANSISKLVASKCKINVVSFNGPETMKGIDFSDHLNYWEREMNAVMVTNTAFYRNNNYHTELDLPGTLNYTYMAWVVEGVLNAISNYNE